MTLVAGHGVIQRIAGTIDIPGSHQAHILNVISKCGANPGIDGVDTSISGLGYDITAIIDHIQIVALTAGHLISTTAAIQPVVAGVTRQYVITGITDKDIVAGSTSKGVGICRTQLQGLRS